MKKCDTKVCKAVNKFLHTIGWKRDGEWDKYEVLVDMNIVFVAIIGVGITSMVIG